MVRTMGQIHAIGDLRPQLPALLAPDAVLIGDLRFGRDCSVWFKAVLRGDINYISIGDRSNIQDHCVLHVSAQRPCRIGADCSLGHAVIAHACHIGDGCLIGMRATVLDGALIGDGCLIAAGCVVGEGLEIPPGQLVAGVPGRVIGPLRPEQRERMRRTCSDYLALHSLYPDLRQPGAG